MNKNRAQSILELIAMIMFIAATIFIGGPTIIRGVNAHFKLWDDTVQDSYRDPLHEAPPVTMPTDCVCDPPIGGPGLRCGIAPCSNTQRLETSLCNPAGCGPALGIQEENCVDDPTCCDFYRDTILCGTGGPSPDCPLGERITQRPCGGGITEFSCRVDNDDTSVDGNPTCIPHCIGSYNPNETAALANPSVPIICPGDDVGVVGSPWIQDASGIGIAITNLGHSVAVCNHPPSPLPDNKCEAYCLPGYIEQGAGCVPNYCLISYTVASVANNTSNVQSFTQCQATTIASANQVGPGCSNPGTPSTSCSLQLLAPFPGPGFLSCQRDYTVATTIFNGTNIQNFTVCQADTITSTTTGGGAGCGNPGSPGASCVVITY